jgi:hypothetical protein
VRVDIAPKDTRFGYNTNRRVKVHKKRQLTPSCRFPLQAGGTKQARGSVPLAKRGEPTEGGNCEL